MSLGRHVFNYRHHLLKKRIPEVPEQLENQALEGDDLGAGVDHALEADVSIVMIHGTDGIHHQVHLVILFQEVHAGLPDADVRLGSVEDY